MQLLQESQSLDEQDAELLTIAHQHTGRINRIIDDVLQLSNRKNVNSEAIDLGQVVANFCKRFIAENQLQESQLQHITEPNIVALFDPDHLDQVLWNLCSNSYLHNDHQDIKISITCWQSQQGAAVIDIIDNGVGISDLHREQLFEPFYSTHHNGSGLGLYIISELCDLNKAHIECIERSNGAHFCITLSTAERMAA